MDKVCANCSASAATIMCNACKSFLCKQCDTEIHKNKIFSTHKREKATDQATTFPSTTTCNKHNEPILAVCKECKEACCLFCITEFHAGHPIIQYAIHLETCKEKQEGIQKYFEMHTSLATGTSSVVKDEIKALKDNGKLTVDQINEVFQMVSQLLEKRKDALIKEVTEKTDDIKGRIEAEISKINENCLKAESVTNEIGARDTENDALFFSKCVSMEKIFQDIGASVSTIINAVQNDIANFGYSGIEDKEINDKLSPLHLEVAAKYNSEPKPLRISSHTDESGKRVFESDGTSMKVTWNLVPKYVDTLVQRTKYAEYVLECKVAEKSSKRVGEPHDGDDWPSNCCSSDGNTSPTIVYSGKDTSASYTELEKGKIVVFRVSALLQYHEYKQVLWTSNFLTAYGNNMFNFEWKPCPSDVSSSAKYELDKENNSIATQINGSKSCSKGCTIVGSEPLPLGAVIQWKIKYINGESNGCCGGVGVAPISIDQNEDRNAFKCGWYYNPYASILRSGPPHKYSDKEYGPREGRGSTIDTGDEIGVIMDMEKGTLSYIIKGVNYGVAFKDIPLDEPLVPCVITGHIGDSVEITVDDV